MDSGLLEAVGKYGIFLALCIYAASLLIPKLFSARTGVVEETANSALITGLSARIDALEKAQADAMTQFDAERTRRLAAESTVASLTTRVAKLEAQIRALGHDPQ